MLNIAQGTLEACFGDGSYMAWPFQFDGGGSSRGTDE